MGPLALGDEEEFPPEELHGEPVGVIVYKADPDDCEIVVLATPEVQEVGSIPPPAPAEIERSLADDINVKDPLVEDDIPITTLVALTVKLSATEPEAIVKFMAGEEREMVTGAT
jgi:hypothetical protein